MDYVVLGILGAALVVLRTRFTRITVIEYEKGLKYEKGKFVRLLEPGRHWIYESTTSVQMIDVRPCFVSVPGQEVLSADGVTLKVSLAARFEVVQPEVALHESADYVGELYLRLQLALREIIGQTSIDEVLAGRQEFGLRLMDLCRQPAKDLGLKLLSVGVKDIMFPGELKKIFAQVTQAKQEGLAALERARGETAALRSLANAAKLATDNPALLQLRLIQQLGASQGNSLVLNLGPTAASFPVIPVGPAPTKKVPAKPAEGDS